MLFRILPSVFALMLPGFLIAQQFTQTLRGSVTDATNHNPLTGATIQLAATDYATTTNQLGAYRLENIPVGRYQLVVNYLGYEQLRIAEVLLETGKEVIYNVELRPAAAELTEVVVRADRERVVHPVSIRTITVEETRRFPATFFDPARLATAYAGVVNANDQANGLIIRGNAPTSINWQIAGAEIVNPNHTPNAGTFSDRPTFNGGGVNILSAQLLDNSTLLTGAFPVQYGNALAGILDMNFRAGNNERYEFTGQLGLIGIDLAAEGPFNKTADASFLVNYRYSTIGLLGALGVPLGDEEINFQDVAFNVVLPAGRVGDFTLFGMGGQSENIFAAERDTAVWEETKDRLDIDFDSKMGAIGGTHRVNLTAQLDWNTTYVYSATENQRFSSRLTDSLTLLPLDTDESTDRKSSLFTQLTFRPDTRQVFQLGTTFLDQNYENYSVSEASDLTRIKVDFYEPRLRILRPFISWRGQITDRLTATLGLTDQIFFFDAIYLNDTDFHSDFYVGETIHSIEPRLALDYQFDAQRHLSLAYGRHSQFQSPYRRTGVLRVGTTPGEDPVFNRANHVVLGYRQQLNTTTQLGVEAYWQGLAVEPFVPLDNELVEKLRAGGLVDYPQSGTNYGLEISLQKYLTSSFYYLANTSLYSATFRAENGEKRNSRYNGNYILNLTAGKEWKKEKKNRIAIFGLNARFNYRGGFRQTPINLAQSRATGYTFYTDDLFTERQSDFYKLDLRLYWKKNKLKHNSTLALDIQNVTNRQNVAFNFYDAQQNRVVTKFQLGIIPILNYRIEF